MAQHSHRHYGVPPGGKWLFLVVAVLSKRTASSSSLASSNGTPAEVKLETIRSLIDFDDNPEPPIAPAIPQATQTTAAQLVNPTNSGDNNWASFDVAPEVKVSQGHSNVNSLDSMLSQLSVPSSSHAQVSGAQGGHYLAVAISLSSV
ncbi:ADP-ribosylation factor GTPase-activating protein AGD14-like [Trifolium medium]|uniref:ADP-ribosylation factor GTPase-activating protein AGD14-like n=1 Tax=Trifolium medium TaxID=97028 RepID=A0A392PTF4_9FABA|nr:ADP-ribosylation factor GTPase-activating protein AGD14-like [Trifolium medium]